MSNTNNKHTDTESAKTPDKPESKGWFSGVLLFFFIFLLLSGWIALLLAPPFGTALAIILLVVFLAIFN